MRKPLNESEKSTLTTNGFTRVNDHGGIKLAGSEQIYGQDYISLDSHDGPQGRFVVCHMCRKNSSESVMVGEPSYFTHLDEAMENVDKKVKDLVSFQTEVAEY